MIAKLVEIARRTTVSSDDIVRDAESRRATFSANVLDHQTGRGQELRPNKTAAICHFFLFIFTLNIYDPSKFRVLHFDSYPNIFYDPDKWDVDPIDQHLFRCEKKHEPGISICARHVCRYSSINQVYLSIISYLIFIFFFICICTLIQSNPI